MRKLKKSSILRDKMTRRKGFGKSLKDSLIHHKKGVIGTVVGSGIGFAVGGVGGYMLGGFVGGFAGEGLSAVERMNKRKK